MLSAPFTTPASEEEQVRELHRMLKSGSASLLGPGDDRVELPASVYRILKEAVRNLQLGRSVMIVPEQEQVTTQKVADALGVSRPHVVKLLDAGKSHFTKRGATEEFFLKDALAYAKRRDTERRKILASIAKKAYDEGLYDKADVPEDGEDE